MCGRFFYLCGVGLLIYGNFPPAPVRNTAGFFVKSIKNHEESFGY